MPIQIRTEKEFFAQKDTIRKAIEKDQALLMLFLADPMHALNKLGYTLDGPIRETCLRKWATRYDPNHQDLLKDIEAGKKMAWVTSVSFKTAGWRK